jgi:2-keto-3-deoxy-L-rhamnonate aldolase RhmA
VTLDLLLFSVDPRRARAAVRAGVAAVVVDWEHRGKLRRQDGEGTEVNAHTPDDLRRVRAAVPPGCGTVVVRIDAAGPHTGAEVARALALGADELLLPMVRTPDDVDLALDAVAGRCGLGVLVETQDAVEHAAAIAERPLARVYLGLNDLRIDRGLPTGAAELFAPLLDGTADAVREAAGPVPFGVAGLTRAGGGAPVPTRLLAGELARLDARFTFLRRSFCADVPVEAMAREVPRMLAGVAAARRRTGAEQRADRDALAAAVGALAAPVPRVA